MMHDSSWIHVRQGLWIPIFFVLHSRYFIFIQFMQCWDGWEECSPTCSGGGKSNMPNYSQYARWSYLCCTQRRCSRSLCVSWTIATRWKEIVNKSGIRKEQRLCPADKMCLAISSQFCLCRVYSRYTNTSQGNGRKSPCCRMPFKVHMCLFLGKELFFSLHYKYLKTS